MSFLTRLVQSVFHFVLSLFIVQCGGKGHKTHEELSPLPEGKSPPIQNSTTPESVAFDLSIELSKNPGCKIVADGATAWARHYIGADVALSYLARIGDRKSHPIDVAVIDGGFDTSLKRFSNRPQCLKFSSMKPGEDHGTSVTNLIFDDQVGTARGANLSGLIEVSYMGEYDEIQVGKTKLVNRSGGLAAGQLDDFVAGGGIVVAAAGNDYGFSDKPIWTGFGLWEQEISGVNHSHIVVGSISKSGLISGFSEEGELVDVLAPGNLVFTKGIGGVMQQVVGTSFATPLVTGVIANVLSLIPDLHSAHLGLLLKHSSIPTVYHSLSLKRRHGEGIINAYRLVRLAAETGGDVHAITEDFFEKFDLIARKEKADLLLLAKEKLAGGTCESFQLAFQILREAIYLDPTKEGFRELAKIYAIQDLRDYANYYRSLVLSEDEAMEFLSNFSFVGDSSVAEDYYRFVARLGEDHGLYKRAYQSLKRKASRGGAYAASAAIGIAFLGGASLDLLPDILIDPEASGFGMSSLESIFFSKTAVGYTAPPLGTLKQALAAIRKTLAGKQASEETEEGLVRLCRRYREEYDPSIIREAGDC